MVVKIRSLRQKALNYLALYTLLK